MPRLATAVLLLTALLAPAAQADWPSFRGDSVNSGAVASGTYPVFTDVWWNDKMPGNARIEATPVLSAGIVVVADLGPSYSLTTTTKGSVTATSTTQISAPVGVVHGLDAESGKELWTHKMTGPVYGTPAIADQIVYVADVKGVLSALDLHTGAKRYPDAPNIGATRGSITFHEGKVFIGTEAGEMKAFGADLTPLWTFKASEYSATSSTDSDGNIKCDTDTKFAVKEIRGAPAVFDQKVFFGSYNHYIFAIDEKGPGNGKSKPMWIYKAGDLVAGSPSIDLRSDGTVQLVVGSYDGSVYAFNPSPSGEGTDPCYGVVATPTWTYKVPSTSTQISKVHSSPASHLDRVYVGANNGHVYGLDSTNGAKVWETSAGSALTPVTASPVYADGKIVVGSQDKQVYWIDATNGNVLKKFPTQEAIIASPAIDGIRAFAASQDGTVYMFGPEIPKRADLVVSTIRASGGNIQVTVKNQGDAATSANVTVRVLLSGTFLANVETKVLGPGEQAVAAVPLPSPAPASAQVKAIADPDNAIAESNDSNNELQQSVSLVPPVPQTTSSKGGGGIKIPDLALPSLIAGLALAAVAMRRRR